MKTRSFLYSLLSVTIVVGFSGQSFAQDYSRGLKRDLEDVEALYPKRSKASTAAASQVQEVQVNAPAVQAAPLIQQAPAAQPVYIIQQPTTNVDATIVKESRAEILRKQREEVERQNEMKLIEKLEDDRLNAEKERMSRVQGGTLNQAPAATVVAPSENKTQFVDQTGALQQQQNITTPVPVIVVNQPQQPDQQSELSSAAEKVIKAKIVDEVIKKEESRFLLGPMFGISNYPSVSNISGVYSVGASGEWLFSDNKFSISGDVLYSSFDIKNVTSVPCYYCLPYPGTPLITTMNQWNAGTTIKYRFGDHTLKPYVGTYVGYTRRNYSARVTWGAYNDSYTGSNAFDGGFLAGVAIKASDSIIFGGEFRYIWNFSYRTDDPLAYGLGGYTYVVGSPIESLNYYTATLNLRILL